MMSKIIAQFAQETNNLDSISNLTNVNFLGVNSSVRDMLDDFSELDPDSEIYIFQRLVLELLKAQPENIYLHYYVRYVLFESILQTEETIAYDVNEACKDVQNISKWYTKKQTEI